MSHYDVVVIGAGPSGSIAGALLKRRGWRVLVLEAAWAHSEGKSIDRLGPMAKLFGCKAFRDVTAMAQQVHGGIGFTLDYDIQLFYRRAKQLQMNWWDSRYLEELIATEGCLVGASSGANAWAARELARTLPAGSRVVTLFPDGAERYMSKQPVADLEL